MLSHCANVLIPKRANLKTNILLQISCWIESSGVVYNDVNLLWNPMFVSCRRRRIDGTDARVSSSRDGAMQSRKQVRNDVSVLKRLTSSCWQERRRGAETRRRGISRAHMSVWDSGTDCSNHFQPLDGLTTSLRPLNPSSLVDNRCDAGLVCCHHHHHHHHHHHLDLCEQHQRQQQKVLSSDDNQQTSSTSISTLSVHQLPLECRRLRPRPQITF